MKPSAALIALLLCAASLVTHAASEPTLKGEVLEARNVESYTYLRLKTAQGEVWVAVPTSAAQKGAQVTIGNPVTMHNFESKSLKRRFDSIVFGQIVESDASTAAGDVVQARGTVRTDVTVGAGYAYEVLVDDTTLHR
jgi:hypothetical protein